jgi:xylulokinase
MSAELLVGVDLGTTALKAGLFTLDGRLVDLAEETYPIVRPAPDRAEHDPAVWLRALEHTLGALESRPDGRQVAAIGVCSQVNTHVFVDENGDPLRPAILWQDQRCAEIAAELSAAAGDLALAPSFVAPRAEWLRRHEPELWEQTRYVLSPKDFLTMSLCGPGAAASDPVGSFDLVDDTGAYDPRVLALVDGLAGRLPPLGRMDAAIGPVVRQGLPLLEDATVVVGTMDAWGGVYGSGVVEHGQAMEIAGTSEIVGVLSRERHPTPGVVSFLAVDGLHLHAGPTQAGGAALAWFGSLARLSVDEVVSLAGEVDGPALLFLPHLLGERAPLWDSEVRGGFVGLGSDHSLAHLCRAVLEGVAFSMRHLLEEIEIAAGVEPAELRASGGGAQSDLWCQIKADVTNRPVLRLQVRQSGCLGAALMAAVGAGFATSLREAAASAVRVDRIFEPTVDRAGYDERYAIYRDLYHALKPAHAALADLRRKPSAVPTT